MRITAKSVNLFLLMKLPAAFFCGVRLKSIDSQTCTVSVTHRWINQNPFRSMYFAVQAMAAELSTGTLVFSQIKASGQNVSMLVGSNKGSYLKKATGRIVFTCSDGDLVSQALRAAIATREGQSVTLRSVGKNAQGEIVSEMEFVWQIKIK